MWKTNDPRMQPQVDEVNRIISTLFNVAEKFKVEPNKLIILMSFQTHKAVEIVTNCDPSSMERTLHGAKVMRVVDLEGFAIVMSPDVTDSLLKGLVLDMQCDVLKEDKVDG